MVGLQAGFFDKPLRAGQFTARPYQQRQDRHVDGKLQAHRSTLVVAATGTGKTVLFCMQAAKRGGCLVLAHRDSLIRQAAEKLQMATGEIIHIEKAQERAHFGAKFIVGSIQTIKGDRLKKFAFRFPDIKFIIIDEAHRATAKSYRDIIDAFPGAQILGCTATPDRSDEVGLGAVFDSVADEYDIIEATTDGWLTPLKFYPVQSAVNLDGIKLVGKGADRDFDQAQLDDAISREAGRIAQSVFEAVTKAEVPDARLIVFTPGVKTAHAGADAMNELRPGSAGVVDGEMSDEEKRPVIEAHRKGELLYLFNCAVLTEGYDDATLTGIFDAAPTKSRLRALQKWGRSTRIWPQGIDGLDTAEARRAAIAASPKPWALIFDLVCNSAKHDVVGPLDVLAGKEIPVKVREAAKKILREEGGTVDTALEEARKQLAARSAARRLAAATKVLLGQPRTIFDRAGINWMKRNAPLTMRPEDRASANMIWKLNDRRIPVPSNCSKRMFRRLLSLDQKREDKGLCRLGSVEWLRQFGVEGWSLTSDQVRRVHAAILANGRQKLTPQQLGDAIERAPGEDDE